jgi:hypothetical protein
MFKRLIEFLKERPQPTYKAGTLYDENRNIVATATFDPPADSVWAVMRELREIGHQNVNVRVSSDPNAGMLENT